MLLSTVLWQADSRNEQPSWRRPQTRSISAKQRNCELLSTRNNRNDEVFLPSQPATRKAMLALACKGCGAEVSTGSKRCRVCGISRPGSLLRASIIGPTIPALLWLALSLVGFGKRRRPLDRR